MLTDLCKRGIRGKILDQCQLPRLIVVGLMIGHVATFEQVLEDFIHVYHQLYTHTILLFILVD
jgi:hypothetical protein